MKHYRIILFSLLLSLLISSTPGFTYSKKTHKELNKKALEISNVGNYLEEHLGFSEGIKEIINEKRVQQWIRDGGETEDESFRYKNHFHNPLEEDWNKAGLSDVFSGTSSIIWAQNIDQGWSWKNAREYYYLALTSATKEERDQNFANMFRALGQVMHLIEDSSVPAHSRNDAHVLYNYEDWVKGADLDSFLANPLFFDEAILDITPNSLAPIPIARIVDTDKYDGANPAVVTGNAIGLSEYANRHFMSADTIFTDDFPYPNLAETNYNELIDKMAEDGQFDRVFYIGTAEVANLAGVTLSRRMVKKLKEDGADDIDPDFWLKKGFTHKYDECLKNYAQLLLPRSVGYSAGLLNYFFRGELKIVDGTYRKISDTKYIIVLEVKNHTLNEDMSDGTFYLACAEEGVTTPSEGQALTQILEADGQGDPVRLVFNDIIIPEGKSLGDFSFFLVFQGTLGSEINNAVVGKKISDLRRVYPEVGLKSTSHAGYMTVTVPGVHHVLFPMAPSIPLNIKEPAGAHIWTYGGPTIWGGPPPPGYPLWRSDHQLIEFHYSAGGYEGEGIPLWVGFNGQICDDYWFLYSKEGEAKFYKWATLHKGANTIELHFGIGHPSSAYVEISDIKIYLLLYKSKPTWEGSFKLPEDDVDKVGITGISAKIYDAVTKELVDTCTATPGQIDEETGWQKFNISCNTELPGGSREDGKAYYIEVIIRDWTGQTVQPYRRFEFHT